jgi:acetyl-CoA C-acetyltransferase
MIMLMWKRLHEPHLLPIGASGIRMMYEIYKQLQGKADKRQVADAKVGLTHNLGGIPGSASVSVSIVSKELG